MNTTWLCSMGIRSSAPLAATRRDVDALLPTTTAVANAKHLAELEREVFFRETGTRIDAQGRLVRDARVADRRGRHV